jgi:shikimate dehydrogenase
MKNTFHFNTQVIGLIGHPVKQSYSPFIHNIAINLKNIDYIYLPFDIPSQNLKSALSAMTALSFKGLNVTIPHKETAIPFMNNLSEEVKIIGSLNTIVNDQGKLVGYNTDVFGIVETLQPFYNEISGSQVVLVGAGGSARAVIYALIRHFKPKRIYIINRNERRAETLKEYFSEKMKFSAIKTKELLPPSAYEIMKDSKLIINATPVGMAPNENDSITTSRDIFSESQIIFDLVYNPQNTLLLKTAAISRAKTLNGLAMLINQAAKSFELWTCIDFPREDVQKSLHLYLNN